MERTRTEQELTIGNQEGLARLLGGIGPDYDYSQIGKLDSRGHGSDIGKLPWHPTFSNQSNYASMRDGGGQWGREVNSEGMIVDSYMPSQQMVDRGNTAGLADYMRRIEPGVMLVQPNQLGARRWE